MLMVRGQEKLFGARYLCSNRCSRINLKGNSTEYIPKITYKRCSFPGYSDAILFATSLIDLIMK